jgi:hypothetical protein
VILIRVMLAQPSTTTEAEDLLFSQAGGETLTPGRSGTDQLPSPQ